MNLNGFQSVLGSRRIDETTEKEIVDTKSGVRGANRGDGEDIEVREIAGNEREVAGDESTGVEGGGVGRDVAVDLGKEEGDARMGGEAVEVVEARVGGPDGIEVGRGVGDVGGVGEIEEDEDLVGAHQMPEECLDFLFVGSDALGERGGVGVVGGFEEGQAVDFAGIVEDVERTLVFVAKEDAPGKLSERSGLVRKRLPGDGIGNLRKKAKGAPRLGPKPSTFGLMRAEGIDERHRQHGFAGTLHAKKRYVTHRTPHPYSNQAGERRGPPRNHVTPPSRTAL